MPNFTSDQLSTDPYLWLEDVEGKVALDWVKQHNAVSQNEIELDSNFKPIYDELLAINNSHARIPAITKIGAHYYNFWRDEQHQRGVWRRTSLEEYRKPEPVWQTVLDVDALASKESENWVWAGASCLYPAYTRCLISLSRGGSDAHVVREFDLANQVFVQDGFYLPEAKGGLSWIDEDHVYVNTDFGPASLTDSGYPRVVKEWKRGTPLAAAKTVFEGQKSDVTVDAYRTRDWIGGKLVMRQIVNRSISFYTSEYWLRTENGLIRIDIPEDAGLSSWHDQILITLRSDWVIGQHGNQNRIWPQGALLAMNFDRFMAGERDFEILFSAQARSSLAGATATRHFLLLNTLENLNHKLERISFEHGHWKRQTIQYDNASTVTLSARDSDESDDYFITQTGPLSPTSLMLAKNDHHDKPELLKQLPSFFDPTGMMVTQHLAISRDGTAVPYVQISPKDFREGTGSSPTLLYGYGGFEISLLPAAYSASIGKAWLSRGGVFVWSGIRGGGEFGPAWHQAAILQNKQKSYDDFIAIAEDLIKRKVTSPQHLGIEGGSNGGLLVGAVFTQRPDLFKAVVCQVPLLDMYRYHKLLAGASWMGEYGNPEIESDWSFISKYSPYQNIRADVHYPRAFFTTSTRDDRVHPGHARKMVARMEQQGHSVLYYENIEGGHAGAANNKQVAYKNALEYTFMLRELSSHSASRAENNTN